MDEYNIAEELMNSFSNFAEIIASRRIWQYKDDSFTIEILRTPPLPNCQPHEIANYRLNIYFSSMCLYDPEEKRKTSIANLSMGNDLEELKKISLCGSYYGKLKGLLLFGAH
jgi:hypothetical protein